MSETQKKQKQSYKEHVHAIIAFFSLYLNGVAGATINHKPVVTSRIHLALHLFEIDLNIVSKIHRLLNILLAEILILTGAESCSSEITCTLKQQDIYNYTIIDLLLLHI